MRSGMIVLGIETSCDETAVALVDDRRRVLAHRVAADLADHARFGGVVPEVAARAHVDRLRPLVEDCMAAADRDWDAIDAIAATCGPGLIGGVLVGASFGKALAIGRARPFVAVNHLEAHALTARLTDDVQFPFLLLLVSGGHALFAAVAGVGRHDRFGGTIDDAVGEAFDKVAKMLGLGFPGGPAVERLAAEGDPVRFRLPRPLRDRPGCDLSLSGLKTAVRHAILGLPPGPLAADDRADICAGFQAAVGDVLADRLGHAIDRFRAAYPQGRHVVLAGGVAANQALRRRLAAVADAGGLALVAPPVALCTDNGAMVAWAGLERRRLGEADGIGFAPRPRWPLESLTPPGVGA
jgi:N6-L-threonylcarbamoyladenine synthase